MVSWSQLWDFTPGRSLNSQLVSLTVFQSVASCGISFRSESRVVRVSKMSKVTVMSGVRVLMWGSSLVMSLLVATTRVRLSGGALALAGAGLGWAAGAAEVAAGAAAVGLVGS